MDDIIKIVFPVIAIMALVGVVGFFASSETAFLSLQRVTVRQLLKEKPVSAAALRIAWLKDNTDRLIMIGRSALYYEDYVLSIQYFNQAISAKPYLYEPWFFRGVAKFYLDDFRGAESDCTKAIERNPYVTTIYELRGLCRINQKKYTEAIDDYTHALRYNPDNLSLWHNRVLCRINEKDYERGLAEIDTMLTHWSNYARAYSMQAEIYLLQKDTTKAVKSLDKSLDLDPYGHQSGTSEMEGG